MSGDEAKKQPTAEEQHRSIKNLSQREYRFLKELMSRYPGFASLSLGDQLDRMILILQSACGYGAVSKRIVGQIQETLNWGLDFDVEAHFRGAEYTSEETGGQQTCYRESFEGSFCLKREFMNQLSNEGEESAKNEPIRKKVKTSVTPLKTKPALQAKAQPKKVAAAKPANQPKPQAPTPAPTPENPKPSSSSGSTQAKTAAASEQPPTEVSPFKPWMIFAAVGVLIIIVITVFTISN